MFGCGCAWTALTSGVGHFSVQMVTLEFPCISGPQKKLHHEQRADAGQAAGDGTNIISHHVQPRIEWSIRQAINGRAIDKQIEGMQFGIGLTSGVAIKVRLRDTASMKFLHAFAGLLAQLVDRAEVD